MAEKMLIDASHPEETRVVVVRGNRIEEFDFESEHKKQLRGNIYLAKVTRVEPSLQAAFVDYGGNRHGFLAFSEIHPDYYQIPLADRQALLQAEAEDAENDPDFESADEAETGPTKSNRNQSPSPKQKPPRTRKAAKTARARNHGRAAAAAARRLQIRPRPRTMQPQMTQMRRPTKTAAAKPVRFPPMNLRQPQRQTRPTRQLAPRPARMTTTSPPKWQQTSKPRKISEPVSRRKRKAAMMMTTTVPTQWRRRRSVESVGSEDAMEEVPTRSQRKPRKQYRIQEVIKRRQILLVQVVKEERGNKGAALTTYLSLAGRYSVLMPNTARGGGISRKITNLPDRKRLKEIARELEVPEGHGRDPAHRRRQPHQGRGQARLRISDAAVGERAQSDAEIDSAEPRLRGRQPDQAVDPRPLQQGHLRNRGFAGEEGYREAKDFMKMLMPSHAKVVQPYRDLHPIFARSGIEAQLDRMLQPQVTLKSGGYIIINQTEALVAIDVNSGRSTREHSIEDTALQTNLEAAEEVARQLRLRDLAGLIVIDFIDMEENRNNRAVEKRMKDCLKNDRARIQVGRISHFGLLEMSRQRIRASVLESTMQICPTCGGNGHIRSQSSVALHVLRGVEEYLLKNTTHDIIVRTTADTALYMLNHKRDTVVDLENGSASRSASRPTNRGRQPLRHRSRCSGGIAGQHRPHHGQLAGLSGR
jgi:ribonuclease E